jgi:hypothetical protein
MSLSPKAQAIVDAADAVLANDDGADIAWSPAWIAAQVTRTYSFKRVPKEEGSDCCNGQMCYHFVASVTKKVKGDGADAPSGKAVSLHDGIIGRRRFQV